jgi:hypothetical protein
LACHPSFGDLAVVGSLKDRLGAWNQAVSTSGKSEFHGRENDAKDVIKKH